MCSFHWLVMLLERVLTVCIALSFSSYVESGLPANYSPKGMNLTFMYVRKGLVACHNTALEYTSLDIFYKHLYKCSTTQWEKCLWIIFYENENMSTNFPCGNHYISWHGDKDYSYHIKVLPTFQVNLTFLEFFLSKDLWGCSFHKLLVSVSY